MTGRTAREDAILQRRLLRLESERRGRLRVPSLVVPLALLAIPLLIVALLASQFSAPVAAGSGEATLERIAADPDAYMGQVVTVVGAVEERYGGRAFSIGRPGSREDVVVLPRGRARRHLQRHPARGVVRVTGKVRHVHRGDRDVVRGDLAVLRGGAAILAQKVERAGG